MTDDETRPDGPWRLFSRPGPILAAVHHLSSVRRPVLLPGISLPARPGLLLLTALLLSLLCLVLTIRGRPTSPPVAEFALLSDQSSSNLNSTSAEAQAFSAAPQAVESSPDATRAVSASLAAPEESALRDDSPAAAPVLLVPERLAAPTPLPISPSPAELPRRLAAEESQPIVPATALEFAKEDCYPIRDPHQGDTPMMSTWKMLGLKTLLAALFAAAPGFGSNTSGPLSDAEKLDQIQKQLNELKNSLADVKKTIADARTDSNVGAQTVQSQISELNKQIIQVLSAVDGLRNRPPSSDRIAASPSLDTGPGTGTARIEMANTYPQPVSIVINNRRSYVLSPGERRLSDPVPAGSFTYEILGVTPMVTRTVAADKIFTVWVHPQP